MDKKDTGKITIIQKKKKREIIEEQGRVVNVPAHESEEKKALQQTEDDATQGW